MNIDNSEFELAKGHFLLGLAHLQREDWRSAEAEFRVSLQYMPNRVSTLTNLGAALIKQGELCESRLVLDKALLLDPTNSELALNRGLVFLAGREHKEALSSFDLAVQLSPDYAEAWSNRAVVLCDLRRYEDAFASCDRAIELKPDYAEAWLNRGVALCNLRRPNEALLSYEKTISLNPRLALAWRGRGNLLGSLRRSEEAVADYLKAFSLEPKADYILGDLVHAQMKICEWTELEKRRNELKEKLLTGGRASAPFHFLTLIDSPELQRRCAEIYAEDKLSFNSNVILESLTNVKAKAKIRVGYFSMDFCEHPVSYLISELIECHDRSKFEIYGFSFGVVTDDPVHKRLKGAFDKFFDTKAFSDSHIARLARDNEIDIAVDLGGHTKDSRPAIFARRAAPIQINYLGYPGTFGSECMDYIIGDRFVIPKEKLDHFSEKVIFLPNSFQVNPSKRPSGSNDLSRESFGLPKSGFVFCCLNNTWKLTPECVARWARILNKVPDSFLWLYLETHSSQGRLVEAFQRLGVDQRRLVFSSRLSRVAYLRQYKFADLFLDTVPYNAGTTASDALWMGLPVLTLAGESFAARMGASLLNAVGLPELVTHNEQEYEALAVSLASEPGRLSALRARLVESRLKSALFNPALFTRDIESAYQEVNKRYHQGVAPDHIYIGAGC